MSKTPTPAESTSALEHLQSFLEQQDGKRFPPWLWVCMEVMVKGLNSGSLDIVDVMQTMFFLGHLAKTLEPGKEA